MLAEELVLVHGWGMNAAVWQPFLPYLEEYRVTRVELPGHGEQPWSAVERDLQSWGDAVLAQAPERAIWCGWSLGGQVALQAALNQPERVSALVLMASTPCFVQHPGWDHAMAADTLAQFARQLHQDVAATLNRFLTLQVRGSADMRPTLNLLRTALAERTPARREALDQGLGLLLNTDLRQQLGRVLQPQLWLQGDKDTLIPAAAAVEIAALANAARVETISGAAHAPFLSHAPYCAQQIKRFVRHG